MRAIKVASFLFTLILAFTLGACGSSPATQSVKAHTSLTNNHSTVTISPVVTATPTPDGVANPVRLIIPSIGVTAPVEHVSILSNGDLATPVQNQWEHVGWYETGPRPGEIGARSPDRPADTPSLERLAALLLMDISTVQGAIRPFFGTCAACTPVRMLS